jgi:N-acyl-D-amino-acid deacylase
MLSGVLLLFPIIVSAADYDILIRNGRVVDGSGAKPVQADVAITSGKISAIGRLSGATARRTIDADGLIVAPGFIDIHTHVEADFEKNGTSEYVPDGVTTIVSGNCGFSPVDLEQFFKTVGGHGIRVNLAQLIGHNAVRKHIMTDPSGKATPEEIARMKDVVAAAMRSGAFGFSTGLNYFPGNRATFDELVSLASAAGHYGGLYATHMRTTGAGIVDAIDEACRIGQNAKLRVQISHLNIDEPPNWGLGGKALGLIQEFRNRGLDVRVDAYPYNAFVTRLQRMLPMKYWDHTDQLRDPQVRKQALAEAQSGWLKDGYKDLSHILVTSYPGDQTMENKTIDAISRLKGRSNDLRSHLETLFELVESSKEAWCAVHSFGPDDKQLIMREANTAIASDGRRGTNARVLAEYVRTKNLLSLEDAVRKMTSLPAAIMKFTDRGLLREGYAADIVVFDLQKIADRATYYPHSESTAAAEGFAFVMVNGVFVVERSRPTTARPGKILRMSREQTQNESRAGNAGDF